MNLFKNLRNDLPASMVVFFVAVPLCLGIALASGAPLFSGLIAGVVGGFIVGIVSGSSLGVSGPAAGLAVIVYSAIEALGAFEAFLLAVFLSGVMQAVLGVARAGVLGYFFPSSVIKGMLAGIGVIIVLKQIPHAFGYDDDPEGDFAYNQVDGETTMSSLMGTFDHVEPGAMFVAAVALGILILWEAVLLKKSNIFKIVPGPLVAVGFGIIFQALAPSIAPSLVLSADHLVSVPVPNSWAEVGDLIISPDWSQWSNTKVWTVAITIAVVASLETLLCVAATDKLDPEKNVTPTNRELVAQGAGNMVSGLLGGLPVTQVIVRSSANIQSGGKTKLAAILHGVWLAVFVLILPNLLNMIPLAVLASILFVVGYKLARPALFRQMWGLGMDQFLPFVLTIIGIVYTDLLTGIGIGMALAILVILRRNYLNSHFLHMEKSQDSDRQHVQMHLSEEVTFLNKGAIIKELDAVAHGSIVTIDKSACKSIDHDIIEVISEFKENAASREIEVKEIEAKS